VHLNRVGAGTTAALILGILGITGTFGSVFPATPAHAALRRSCWNAKPAEQAFAKRMNGARGARRLRLDPQLSKVARAHTRAMTRRHLLFHSSSSQLRRRVVNWTLLGENVGYGSTVRSLHRAFMASPPHRANIKRAAFRNVGIGVRRRHGLMWVTVIFQSRANPGTTLPMPSC
jgi:uncharacterized protein YkwD